MTADASHTQLHVWFLAERLAIWPECAMSGVGCETIDPTILVCAIEGWVHKCFFKAGLARIRKDRHQENAWLVSQEVLRMLDGSQCFKKLAGSVEVESELMLHSFALFPWIML